MDEHLRRELDAVELQAVGEVLREFRKTAWIRFTGAVIQSLAVGIGLGVAFHRRDSVMAGFLSALMIGSALVQYGMARTSRRLR